MNYVLKYKGKYLKFGSYSKAVLVDRPEKASIWSRLSDAEYRIRYGGWIDRKHIPGNQFQLYSVEFTWKELKL
jgi:hypothetical protein